MVDYAQVLTKYYPNSEWYINGDEYENLVWLSETEKPSQEALDTLYLEIIEEKNKTKYREQREAEYNARGADLLSVVEALRESISEGRNEKLVEIKNIIDTIKLEFPKPTEQ